MFGLDDVAIRETDEKLNLDYVAKTVGIDETVKQLKVTMLANPTQAVSSSSGDNDISAVHSSKVGFRKNVGLEFVSSKCIKCCRWHAPRKYLAHRSKCRTCNKVGRWAGSSVCGQREVEVMVEKRLRRKVTSTLVVMLILPVYL